MSTRPGWGTRLRKAKGGVALLSAMAMALVIGLVSIGIATSPPPRNLRGAIGADYHAQESLSDWGVDTSLQHPATNPLTDDDVFISVQRWKSGDVGQTQPTTTDTGNCNGTVRRPTAPDGKVCIYVEGGDNAQDVNGYSVRPGTRGSRFGFKLAWTNTEPGDTFIDAVWVYNFPGP
jgi:hypothetical protein